MIVIDGSMGEGGGQILRSALALSLITGKPFTINKIRAKRANPGLLRQHLTAVQAAVAVGSAEVTGAQIGASTLTFTPQVIAPGNYVFAVGTAGSTTLVLQTVLPALITATAPSQLRLRGGTHNPSAPPFDFLVKTFLPLLQQMGALVTVELLRPGFYPAGGGEILVTITPTAQLQPLVLLNRGEILRRQARAVLADLPDHIAQRELKIIADKLSWPSNYLKIEQVQAASPGNIVLVEIESTHITEVFTSFGKRGVRAEAVAEEVVKQVRAYLASGAPVGEYLADQLLLPLALAGKGQFLTQNVSRHLLTNIEVIRQFLTVAITTQKMNNAFLVQVQKTS
jgi:RNA 3'-terminal phosphate cyclase (ATP)